MCLNEPAGMRKWICFWIISLSAHQWWISLLALLYRPFVTFLSCTDHCGYQVLRNTVTLHHWAEQGFKESKKEKQTSSLDMSYLGNQIFYFILCLTGYYIHLCDLTFTKKCDKCPQNRMSSTIGVMLGISIIKTMAFFFFFLAFAQLAVMCQFSLPHCRDSLSSNDSVWQIQTTSTLWPWHLFWCNANL